MASKTSYVSRHITRRRRYSALATATFLNTKVAGKAPARGWACITASPAPASYPIGRGEQQCHMVDIDAIVRTSVLAPLHLPYEPSSIVLTASRLHAVYVRLSESEPSC